MSSTRVVRVIRAPRARVYRALLDPAEVPRRLHPDGMRCEVHAFEPRVGGRFRISLTYEDPAFAGRGKSGGATDTFSGSWIRKGCGGLRWWCWRSDACRAWSRHDPSPDAINRRRYGPVMHVSTGRWLVIVKRECCRPPVLLGPRKATPVSSGPLTFLPE